jgi:hypothetical protein
MRRERRRYFRELRVQMKGQSVEALARVAGLNRTALYRAAEDVGLRIGERRGQNQGNAAWQALGRQRGR